MPHPRSISQFPSQWVKLCDKIFTEGRSVTVKELGGKPIDRGHASQLRFSFYRFRSLLRKDPLNQDLCTKAESIEVSIHLAGPDQYWVHFQSYDRNAVGQALEEAMKEEM